MKTKIFTLFLGIVLCLVASANIYAQPAGFEIYAENDYLVLYVNPENTEIVVLDKRTDTLWYSNPPNRATEETVARGVALQQVGSQFSISYFTPGDNVRYLNNRADSVAFGQYEIKPIDQGVRIEYTLGKRWDDASYLPVMISKERFETLILANLSDRFDQKLFQDSFELVKLEKAPAGYEPLEIYRIDKEAVFGEYTLVSPGRNLNETQKKELIELVVDQVVSNRSDIADRRGVLQDDLSQLRDQETYVLKNRIRAWDREDMIELLKQIGYTPEDVAVDHLANNLAEPSENYRTFDVVVEYTINEDNLVVRVPLDEVEFPENVLDETGARVTLPLYSISLLEYFGAGSSSDEGYLFVPDGSGAIAYFNNGKIGSPAYQDQIYGADSALNPRRDRTTFSEQIHLPVFGAKHEDKALFGIVDDGEGFVRIRGDVAGRNSSYNIVFPEIVVTPVAKTQLQGSVEIVIEGQSFRDEINVYQSRPNRGDVSVIYSFLYDDKASYVGMARTYQDYLVEKYDLERLAGSGDIPFFLELVGAANAQEPVLGVPRNVIKPMTSFDQAEVIVAELLKNGVSNLTLRYSGWLAGGLNHRYPNKARVESELGTTADLQSFNEYLQQHGIDLFLDVNFPIIHKQGLFDGFIPMLHSARHLNRQFARVFNYDLGTYRIDRENFGYVLSQQHLDNLISSFLADFEKYNVSGLSLRNMGTQVNSDFREADEKLVDRQQSLTILNQQLAKVKNQDFQVLLDGGNAYALPYADAILNVPLNSSEYQLFDKAVPFMQIALHGYVNYAGEPINQAQDYRNNLLRTIESGANPYYLWTFEDSSVLKNSTFTHLYSTNYRHWLDNASEFYRRANEVLQGVQNQLIEDHFEIAPEVFATVYENGDAVIVNYQNEEVQLGGIVVPAEDFLLLKGGDQGDR